MQYLSKKKVRLIQPKEYTPYAGKVAFGSLVLSERKFEGEPELLFGEPCDVKDVKFALIVVEAVKSNAIVIVKDGVTVGIGGGQPSRKRSAWIATTLAKDNAKGAIAASDAFSHSQMVWKYLSMQVLNASLHHSVLYEMRKC